MEIFKEFKFESAHVLTGLPAGHKCGRLHGHSYRVRVVVAGAPNPARGWVMDYADIKRVAQPVIERLDHAYLNDLEGLEQPTTENLAVWLWRQLSPAIPGLARLELWETATSGVIYRGEHEPR